METYQDYCKGGWTFYNWGIDCQNGQCKPVFTKVKHTRVHWPNIEYEKLAAKLGYDQFCKDSTIIGGHFSRPGGDCLIVVPDSVDPYQLYG